MKGLLCFLCFFIFMIDVFFCTYLLGIKWGDHFFSKLLIAAVINYKFSQPNNADYQQCFFYKQQPLLYPATSCQ